jgi:hypothetical protein
MRQPVRNDARLARTCARDDQERLRRIENGFDLRRVQLAAEVVSRKAIGRAGRRCREEIRRFHALVIQIAGVVVDSPQQGEADSCIGRALLQAIEDEAEKARVVGFAKMPAEVEGEPGGIHESAIVRTVDGGAVLGAGNRCAARGTQNR